MAIFARRLKAEREAAERVYAACLNAARHPAFYLDDGVPDTFEGRFEVLTLTLFPVLNRLMHDPGDDPDLARRISESFVDDMDAVFREMGVSDPGIPKRMKALYGAFAGRITAYRAALGEGDSALADAIARNVFPGMQADKRVAVLAEYLKTAVRSRSAHRDGRASSRRNTVSRNPSNCRLRVVSVPFHFPVQIARVSPGGKHFLVAANDEQRKSVATALGIVEVVNLAAELDVRPTGGDAFAVKGTLRAGVVQADVVTLEPVEQEVREEIDLILVPRDAHSRRGRAWMKSERPMIGTSTSAMKSILVRSSWSTSLLGSTHIPARPESNFRAIRRAISLDSSPFSALAKLKREQE